MNDTWYDMGFDADMSWMYDWKGKEKKMTREEAWRRTKGYLYDVLSGEEADEIIKALEPKTGHWIMPQQDDGMSDPIYYQVRCSECGFDLDPQTWHQELHQYDADKFCPKCGCPMKIER